MMQRIDVIEAVSHLSLSELKTVIEHAEAMLTQRRDEMKAELERQAKDLGLIVNEPTKRGRRKSRDDRTAE